MSCVALALAAPNAAFASLESSCLCCISSIPEAVTVASRTLLFSSFNARVRGPDARESPIDPRAYAAYRRTFQSPSFSDAIRASTAFLSLMFPRAAAAFARTVPSVSLRARIRESTAWSTLIPREDNSTSATADPRRTLTSSSLRDWASGTADLLSLIIPRAKAAFALTYGSLSSFRTLFRGPKAIGSLIFSSAISAPARTLLLLSLRASINGSTDGTPIFSIAETAASRTLTLLSFSD